MSKRLIVLSGPSGVGKGTIAKLLVDRNDDIALSISCTTRSPRPQEKDGREYFFITKDEFLNKAREGGFLEYSEHFGNYYGTPKDFVLKALRSKHVLLEIDVNGGLEVKKNFPNALLIMVLPPNIDELKARLRGRNTETEENIKVRLQRIEYELSKKDAYDILIVNDVLSEAVSEVEKVIKEKSNSKDSKGEIL